MSFLKRFVDLALSAFIAGIKGVTANDVSDLSVAKPLPSRWYRNKIALLIQRAPLRKLCSCLVISTTFSSCFPAKEVQAELTYATLVKVEEVDRYPNVKQKMFTWKSTKIPSFVTIEPMYMNIPIGTRTRVLIIK